MGWMLLIIEEPGDRRARTDNEGRAMYEEMMTFSEGLKARGQLVMSQSLRADTQGVRVKARAGAPSFVDGPFAEAKEIVGGFFLLTVGTRDEALAIAAACPAAQWATVEVRELGPCFT